MFICFFFQNLHLYTQQGKNKLRDHLKIQTQFEVPDGRKYVQSVPDGTRLCPDRPRRNVRMSRPSQTEDAFVQTAQTEGAFVQTTQTEGAFVQTFVRSPDFRAFMSGLSCVYVQTFVRSPDFRAFINFLCDNPIFYRNLHLYKQHQIVIYFLASYLWEE